MSSAVRGVQGIIRQSSPTATYIHCNAHVLNLAIVSSCSLPPIRNMAGNVMETAKFFNFSPKRQRLFEKVILKNQPEARKQKLRDLCRTRWVQHHEAYEAFTELYPSVIDMLCIMLHEEDHTETYGRWNWDRETLTRAASLHTIPTSFEFLVPLVAASNALSSVRPLSAKLQRKAPDIVKAYSLVSSTIADLEHLRASDDEVTESYEQARLLGESMGSEPRVRRITGRQQHRENVDSSTPEEYYCRSVILPFLDHLITDMKARFNGTATAASQVLSLVPEVVVEQEDPTTKIAQLGEIYAADLPNLTTLSTDIRKWRRKWDSTVPLPNTPIAALQQCDPDVFPNIHSLLKLACTLPYPQQRMSAATVP